MDNEEKMVDKLAERIDIDVLLSENWKWKIMRDKLQDTFRQDGLDTDRILEGAVDKKLDSYVDETYNRAKKEVENLEEKYKVFERLKNECTEADKELSKDDVPIYLEGRIKKESFSKVTGVIEKGEGQKTRSVKREEIERALEAIKENEKVTPYSISQEIFNGNKYRTSQVIILYLWKKKEVLKATEWNRSVKFSIRDETTEIEDIMPELEIRETEKMAWEEMEGKLKKDLSDENNKNPKESEKEKEEEIPIYDTCP